MAAENGRIRHRTICKVAQATAAPRVERPRAALRTTGPLNTLPVSTRLTKMLPYCRGFSVPVLLILRHSLAHSQYALICRHSKLSFGQSGMLHDIRRRAGPRQISRRFVPQRQGSCDTPRLSFWSRQQRWSLVAPLVACSVTHVLTTSRDHRMTCLSRNARAKLARWPIT